MSQTPKYFLDKIREAKEKGLKKLDLSSHYISFSYYGLYLQLSEIPLEVFELEQLESLDLSGNNIEEIPDRIASLSRLQSLKLTNNPLKIIPNLVSLLPSLVYLELSWRVSQSLPQWCDRVKELGLYLSDNQLTTVPESITQLVNLTQLYLSDNQLTTVPESITQLVNLTQLYLSDNQLTTVPESITQLVNLTQLYLSDNQLTTVPESITQLVNLTQLDLSDNQLTTVPESITQLVNLTQLDLRYNQLTTVPESITQLVNLTQLDLRYNQLTTVPESITQLVNLTQLYLSDNQLTTVPESITQLVNLTQLDLRYNQLTTVPESITQLVNLTQLYLSSNQLTTIPESITQLVNLTQLYLSSNQLTTVPESITQLVNLTQLYLSSNQLTTVPESITQLVNLTQLDLSDNQLTTVPESITQLVNLTQLDLRYNQLTTVPESITQLVNLTQLDLRYNQLTTVPESITQLVNLTQLYLSDNQLTTVPESITQLVNLTQLYLSDNQLTTVPESITQLVNLTQLDLSDNQLTTVPESITQLVNLTQLDLRYNQLTTVPESITQLVNLTQLDLRYNQLTTVPESITQLVNLTQLYLSDNQLTTVPESITQLVNLTQLDLSDNQLTTVPESITQLVNLTLLDLDDNPLENPPLEIAKKGIIAIREFFQQNREEHDRLYEAKLLIVGEAGAGKTTLSEKICNPNYQLKDEDSTKGIEVKTFPFTMANGEEFRINIWDFGGQEIYHATHQFFLTKRSLYLLVTDTRKEDTDFFYWLNIVELLSDNSPIFIIQNEKQDRHREINARILRGQFNNLKDILSTNLANNRGLENILREIKHQIEQLPHVGSFLPKTWTTIRSILEKDTRNYINLEEYSRICDDNKITKESAKLLLSGYLHDLGVFLHFQSDPLLKNKVILKPEWGTAAVYKVLDNPKAIRNFGKFTRQELKEIWKEEQYNNMRDELLQLMIKFRLCYLLPRTEDTYIAPQLLTLNPPEYHWNENDNLILRYEYEFMPKGILTQFIVALHRNIHQKPNKQQCVWRTGVILDKDNTQAEVIEDRDRRTIKIRITGTYKRDLITIIIHEFEEIHHIFNRLKYKLLIPCNCEFCQNNQDPEFYPFEILRQFERDGKDIQCRKSYNTVNVRSLINNAINRREIFEEERERKRNSLTNIDININTGDNSMSGDRIIKMGSGDYHEREIDNKGVYIEGDYNSQQDLTAAASEIQQLLAQLSQNAPTTNTVEQMQIATQAIQQIERDPSLKKKAIAAFKGGFLEGIKNSLIGSVVAGAIEGWTNAGN